VLQYFGLFERQKMDEGLDKYRFINSINVKKDDLRDDERIDKDYAPYFINLMLSYHKDTLFYAYNMDKNHRIAPRNQYVYLLNTVRPRKRFSKIHRSEKLDDVELIQTFFGYNVKKAKEALAILSSEQLKEIKQRSNRGGLKKDI
jgi:hypothetical protein